MWCMFQWKFETSTPSISTLGTLRTYQFVLTNLLVATARFVFAQMYRVVIISLLWSGVCGFAVDGCARSGKRIQCYNASTFPEFNISVKSGVEVVSVFDSSMNELPSFPAEEWPELYRLELVNTPGLECANISCLERSGLGVVSDCKPSTTAIDWVIVAPFFFGGVVMTSLSYLIQRCRVVVKRRLQEPTCI